MIVVIVVSLVALDINIASSVDAMCWSPAACWIGRRLLALSVVTMLVAAVAGACCVGARLWGKLLINRNHRSTRARDNYLNVLE